jgi:carotenoid cleavage dioxygenase
VLDPKARKCTYEPRYERACEFPRMSPRYEAVRHRFGYVAGFRSKAAESETFFDALLKVDLERGAHEAWTPDEGHYPGEPIFAPAIGGSDEDAGYLLSLVLDATRRRSYVAVIDARKMAEGPVATLPFDQVIPFGFHGAWDERAS